MYLSRTAMQAILNQTDYCITNVFIVESVRNHSICIHKALLIDVFHCGQISFKKSASAFSDKSLSWCLVLLNVSTQNSLSVESLPARIPRNAL